MSEPREYALYDMTWEDAGERIPDADYVVLPCGSIEQHSTHLPLSVDSIRAEQLTERLAERAPEHDLSVLTLPTLAYGYSEHHMTFPGTITLMPDTYRNVVVEIGESMAAHGAERFALVNCHGGNRQPLKLAADRLQRDHGLQVHVVHWTNFARDALQEVFGEDWGHAGDHETSAIEVLAPHLVREGKKEPQTVTESGDTRQYEYFSDLTEQGGLGDPTNADPEVMAEIIAETTDSILESLAEDR